MFKWVCLGVGTVLFCLFGGTLLWMVNDLRTDAKPVLTDLKRDMPTIVNNTKKSTTALAEVSDDIKAVRTVLGLTAGKDKKLIVYTGEILDLIEKEGAGATILTDTKGVGVATKLLDKLAGDKPLTVETWVANTRSKALWVALFGSTSKDEVLDRLCHNKVGLPFLIQVGKNDPVPLKDWVKSKLPAGEN